MAAPRSATGTLLKSDLREDLREPVALDALGAAFFVLFLAAGFLATVFFLAGAAFLAFFAGAYGYKSWRGVWKNFPRRQRALTFLAFAAGLAAAGLAAGFAAGLAAGFAAAGLGAAYDKRVGALRQSLDDGGRSPSSWAPPSSSVPPSSSAQPWA